MSNMLRIISELRLIYLQNFGMQMDRFCMPGVMVRQLAEEIDNLGLIRGGSDDREKRIKKYERSIRAGTCRVAGVRIRVDDRLPEWTQ